jgi:hypothetical protein
VSTNKLADVSGTISVPIRATDVAASQSQSHVTTDGRSVSQSWCRAPSGTQGLMTRFLVLYNDYCGLCPLGAPSLTRGWVCHLSEVFVMFLCRVRIFTTVYTLYTISYVQYVQGLCQSRLREADYVISYLTYDMTTASHLNGRRPDRRQV